MEIKRVIEIEEDILKRIDEAKSVPDMFGTDIVNGLNAIKYSKPYDEAEVWRKSNELLEKRLKYLGNTQGDCISREVINSEIEIRYCSKHCALPFGEPYCPDSCPARFLKNIVKECPSASDKSEGEWLCPNCDLYDQAEDNYCQYAGECTLGCRACRYFKQKDG